MFHLNILKRSWAKVSLHMSRQGESLTEMLCVEVFSAQLFIYDV